MQSERKALPNSKKLIARIYKEFQKLCNKGETMQLINGQQTLTDRFQVKKCK